MLKIFFVLILSAMSLTAQAKLPVSELHVHADAGILTRDLFRQLADKNNLALRSEDFFKDGIIDHKSGDFLDFLRVYDMASSVIVTKEDITTVIYDYLKRSSEQGAIYTELMISPDHFNNQTAIYDQSNGPATAIREVNLSYEAVIDAVATGIDQARMQHDIDARILIVLLRHEGVEKAEALLNEMIAHPHPFVRGINLAGDDLNFPAEMFRHVYKRAKQHGYKLTAHMGEHTGPEDIETAMRMQLDRIGHGLSVIKDADIMAQFKTSGIGIEVCPSSNIDGGNGFFNSMAIHPLKQMLENDLFVSISTDDPSFLHTNIEDEYLMVQQAYGLSDDQMVALCENSIEMSFAEDALKERLRDKISAYKATL